MNTRTLRKTLALLAAIASTSLIHRAAAQDTDAPPGKKEDTLTLEKYVVTGSYIPFAVDAPAVPIKVVDVRQIEASGQSADLLEVIRKTVPQFVGNGNLGSSNSNISGGTTNGGSQLKLRNVQTLVLINGRRAAFAPVSATGGFDFVDVNSIPVSAVERIEVLKDGASALYGSDAVAGVVNIILKKNYEGAEIGGRYAFARDQGKIWEERSGHVTVGAASGKTSIVLTAEWVSSDPMLLDERAFSFDQTGKSNSFPGAVTGYHSKNYVLAPGATPPLNTDKTGADLVAEGVYVLPTVPFSTLFNLNQATLFLGNDKLSAVAALSHRLSDKVELFGDLLYSQTKTFYQLNAQPVVGMPYFSKFVDSGGGPTGKSLAEHPQNPFDDKVTVRNRFTDHPRRYYSDNDSFRGLLGARGQINDLFSWEVAGNSNKVNQMYRNENVINRVNLASAIDNNVINLFKREQDPGAFEKAGLFGTAYSKNESTMDSFDARLNGGFENILPAGPIMFAAGVESRRETLSARPDAGSFTIVDPTSPLYGQPTSWDGATTADNFNVSRKVSSAFLELRIPVVASDQKIPGIHTLDLDLAVRHDKYSDTDDPTVPKATLRWFPVNQEFAVRASFSKSFNAASLFSLFGPSGVGYTDQPVGLEFVDGRVMDDNVDQAFLRILSNSKLKPEKSTNYNFGMIYSPKGIKGLSMELDYFSIKQDQIAGSVNEVDILQDVETNGSASKYADRVRINGFNGAVITVPGQISQAYDKDGEESFTSVFVSNYSENFVSGKQSGLDLNIDYTFDVPSIALFKTSLNAYWYNRFSVDDEDYVGTTNGNSVLNGGTIPTWAGTFLVEATRGNFTAGTVLSFTPSVNDTTADPAETDLTADAHVESYTNVDLYLGYKFGGTGVGGRYLDGLSLRVGANNLFNEKPPLARSSWTDSGSDTAIYNPMGRVIYVTATYKF